jgi:hypothetical protein
MPGESVASSRVQHYPDEQGLQSLYSTETSVVRKYQDPRFEEYGWSVLKGIPLTATLPGAEKSPKIACSQIGMTTSKFARDALAREEALFDI